MKASCHCGRVELEIAHRPDFINLCDCSLCSKMGGAWGYFSESDVTVTGTTASYRRIDREKPACEAHFCPNCGTTTHWVLTEHFDADRVGVNMRLFEPGEVARIEARTLDGRNWFGDTEPAERRPPGRLGEDVFL